ncbi:hypothetical protein [Haloferula rosea]|uniref:Uncharacterized protein n=1 Tax=Haloferula rosea TaxID=490093 RepID=A0A934VFX8_9BACT|nr:hypothetical protein [Haloferula rosea]MBK1827045.1 hypothetical protein [Haloferula rosea]
MVAYQHPSELNPLQRYRQASAILRGTSRASNDGWYDNPLDHEFQLHLHIDGTRVESITFHRPTDTWAPGPQIDEDLILDPSRVPDFAEEVITLAKQVDAKSVGIILHIADEFATTEIKPELDNPGALNELQEAIQTDPKSVLDDGSLSAEDHSWRLIPYPAAGSDTIATAVTLSKHAADFADALRSHGAAKNFPVATLSVSAPLLTLIALPELRPNSNGKSFLTVLNYARFTVLAFFNEHGDLRLLRTLQHRGQRRPSNLRHAAATTAAAMEMSAPDILIFPLAGEPDPQMTSDLEQVFEHSEIVEIDWTKTPYHNDKLAGSTPEMRIATEYKKEIDSPLAQAHTFVTLRNDGWALQDFLPMDSVNAETFPSRSEMKLLRASKYARHGLIVVTILALFWVGLGLLGMVRQPEWTFKSNEATVLNNRLAALGKERQRILHWDNLLEDRSKGWTSMEMLSRFFPERSGFIITGYSHTATPEKTAGQARIGFIKQWRFTGLALEDSLETLADLRSRDGISSAFSEIARVTGNQAFQPDLPTRSVFINVKTQENGAYKPLPPESMVVTDPSHYPYQFELTITQRFEADDPLALNVTAAP